MLTCSWLGGPSATAEAMKRLQLRRWGGRGLSLLSAVSFFLWGFWRLACSPGSLCDQQRQEPAAMRGPGTSLGWTLHLGRV